MIEQPVGFLGAGQMARALCRGFLAANAIDKTRTIGSDSYAESRREWKELTGCKVTASNIDVVRESDVLFLCVKPQVISGVLREIASEIQDRHLIVSIAAGVSLKSIADLVGPNRRLVRVMPNTPCLVNASASAFSLGGNASTDDARLVESLLNCVGISFQLSEALIDAVTGLSGSGPAYVYLMIEALSDGGVKVGLPRNVATALAAQTVLGAAKMVLETNQHPGQLKDMVASPGGTTIAGLASLENNAVRGAFIQAVEAATRRAHELGNR